MRELTVSELDSVSGGGKITNQQCVGAFSLSGGFIGAAVGGSATLGWGAVAGFGVGVALGNALGLMLCESILSTNQP